MLINLPCCKILDLMVQSVSCLECNFHVFLLCDNTTLTFHFRPWKTIGNFLTSCWSNISSCEILEQTVRPTKTDRRTTLYHYMVHQRRAFKNDIKMCYFSCDIRTFSFVLLTLEKCTVTQIWSNFKKSDSSDYFNLQ